jgi:hypothetical protein
MLDIQAGQFLLVVVKISASAGRSSEKLTSPSVAVEDKLRQ